MESEAKRSRGQFSLDFRKLSNGLANIELAKAGERNPDRLCESALEKLRGHLYGDYTAV
jgi:hypothetical protein